MAIVFWENPLPLVIFPQENCHYLPCLSVNDMHLSHLDLKILLNYSTLGDPSSIAEFGFQIPMKLHLQLNVTSLNFPLAPRDANC